MATRFRDIPGYIIICGALVGILLLTGAAVLVNSIVSGNLSFLPHKPTFEELTGYRSMEEWEASDKERQIQILQDINEMQVNGELLQKANLGDARSQYLVGNVYYYGTGSKNPNYAEALEWFYKASDQDYAPAQYQVGRMYANGQGLRPDKIAAIKWYKKAAEGGDRWAQRHLGEIYLSILAEQFGAKRDYREAYFWLAVGLEKNDPFEHFERDRDYAKHHLNQDEIDAVDKRIKEWQTTHPDLSEKPE